MTPPFIRSPYNYDVKAASEETAYVETMPSLTVQSMTEDSDLNIMMMRFGITGKMPDNVRLPSYGDFSHVTDYHSALEALRSAEDSFSQFPANIRAQFENNPQQFLDFVENPVNIEQVKQWFPKENFDGEKQSAGAGRAPPPPSSAPNAPSGTGVTASNGGVGVPQRPAQPGQGNNG